MSTLKLLAQKAKKRLSTVGQTIGCTPDKNTTYLSQSSYANFVKSQDLKNDPLFEKVKKLIAKEDVMNPIAMLTDNKLFASLTTFEKERYVIDISKRYNEIREYILNNEIV